MMSEQLRYKIKEKIIVEREYKPSYGSNFVSNCFKPSFLTRQVCF